MGGDRDWELMTAGPEELSIPVLWWALSGVHSRLCLSRWLYIFSLLRLPSLLLYPVHRHVLFPVSSDCNCVYDSVSTVPLVPPLFLLFTLYAHLPGHHSLLSCFCVLMKSGQGAERGNSKETVNDRVEALVLCQALTDTSSYLILTTSLRGRLYYPHFTDGKRTSKSLSNIILSGIQTEACLLQIPHPKQLVDKKNQT